MGVEVVSVRAYRVSATEADQIFGADSPVDYVDSFGVTATATTLTPEQWVRVVFEGAPRPLRWLLLVGWRVVLGLRLGPRGSRAHVLGWWIVATDSDSVLLELKSILMTSRLRLRMAGSELRFTTAVVYHLWAARVLWAVVGPIHRRVVPHLLGRAARTLRGGSR